MIRALSFPDSRRRRRFQVKLFAAHEIILFFLRQCVIVDAHLIESLLECFSDLCKFLPRRRYFLPQT